MRAGLRELRRVARKRIVILLRNAQSGSRFWLTTDYLPTLDSSQWGAATVATIKGELPSITALQVRLPRDCVDGMFCAYWGRPELYLDSEVRRNISNFALAAEDELAKGLASLQADLKSGAWDRRYGHLRSLPELDLGHRSWLPNSHESLLGSRAAAARHTRRQRWLRGPAIEPEG